MQSVNRTIFLTFAFVLTGALAASAQSSPLQFIAIKPCRIVDTRNTGNPIQGNTSQDYAIQGSQGACSNIPATAAAYSLNVTVIPRGSLNYLTVWPSGEQQPVVSTLNSPDGRIKANAAIVGEGTGAGGSGQRLCHRHYGCDSGPGRLLCARRHLDAGVPSRGPLSHRRYPPVGTTVAGWPGG